MLVNNYEIQEYIKQIREYENQMNAKRENAVREALVFPKIVNSIETDQQKFEILINLRTKKHIFIHSLHSLSRLKKHSKTTKF